MRYVIIASGFFPRMGPRGLRTTELAKELSRQGHDVTVYALLGSYDYQEYSKKTGVKVKQLGISKWGKKDSDGKSHANIIRKAIVRFCGKRFWLPDSDLIPMVRRAIGREKGVDCLITIAKPHVIHYAAALSDLSEVRCWIADCGDPFTLNPFANYPPRFVEYEKLWSEKCDYITVPIQEAIQGYYSEFHHKIRVIPQGFNFDDVRLATYMPHDMPTFAYVGAVYKGLRDPDAFLRNISKLEKDFRFIIYGNSWHHFLPYKEMLGEKLQFGGKLSHDDMLTAISSMDFLINLNNNSGVQQPSKLIDYALSKRPFMSISSSFGEDEKYLFMEFLHGDYSHQETFEGLENYNIKTVAKKFTELTQSKAL